MIMRTIICLYGVCFAPEQVVRLTDTGSQCEIALAYGNWGNGERYVTAPKSCDDVESEINEANEKNNGQQRNG